MTVLKPFPDPDRRDNAKKRREDAAALSTSADHPDHENNHDDLSWPYVFSFTKGLSHEQNGLLSDPSQFEEFRKGTEQHDPRVFAKVRPYRGGFLTENTDQFAKLCCKADRDPYRQWESPTAGHAYVLEGPDPYAVTMPPAPKVGSAEFAAEMAEVYQMALSRDWPVAAFMDPNLLNALTDASGKKLSAAVLKRLQGGNKDVDVTAQRLSTMRWFAGESAQSDTTAQLERQRRRFGVKQTPSNIFRGTGEDGWSTPFLSQFLVMGSGECERDLRKRASGIIRYGAQTIDQKVRVAAPEQDYMTVWPDWLDIQNGLNKRALTRCRGTEFIKGASRPISRLRDMATYVHDDQLYQAYLNAALILLDEKFAFDPGIPFHGNSANPVSRDNREPFALFGGPHLLTLVTEVSSRALKAVRLQKFSIHRRLRPEAAGALFHTVYTGYQPDRGLPGSVPYQQTGMTSDAQARRLLGGTVAPYTFPQNTNDAGVDPTLEKILTDIRIHNAKQNGTTSLNKATWLLPMAFPEGSPMHPAYGAGHATVAGACVTLLKAFFAMSDSNGPVYLVEPKENALVPDGGTNPKDCDIDIFTVPIENGLTLEGELNKLMWNISNARNIAGVHYYTDYIESALLGEAITIGILREQMVSYHPEENVSMTVPLLAPRTLPKCLLNRLDGTPGPIGADEEVVAVKIDRDGTLHSVPATPGRI